MLYDALNKSWKQHIIKEQLYDHLPLSHKPSEWDEQDLLNTAGEVRMNSEVTSSYGNQHMDMPVQVV